MWCDQHDNCFVQRRFDHALAVSSRAPVTTVATFPLDDEGFLLERKLWTRDLAQQLADQQALGTLGQTQWLIIDFVRDRYFRLGALPPMRNLCRKLGVDREAVKKSLAAAVSCGR